MKRTALRRRATLRAKKPLRRKAPLQRTPSMAATERQRAAVAGRRCIVCGTDRRIDPAHLLSGRTRVGMCVLPACSLVGMSSRVQGETSVVTSTGAGSASRLRRMGNGLGDPGASEDEVRVRLVEGVVGLAEGGYRR
jgi:hypothetical protein